MLYWTVVFTVVALVVAALGFGGLAGASAAVAQTLFFMFAGLMVVSFLSGFVRRAR